MTDEHWTLEEMPKTMAEECEHKQVGVDICQGCWEASRKQTKSEILKLLKKKFEEKTGTLGLFPSDWEADIEAM